LNIAELLQVVLATAYRSYVTATSWLGVKTRHCGHVTRGGNRQPIKTCVGEIVRNLHTSTYSAFCTSHITLKLYKKNQSIFAEITPKT